MGVYAFLGKGLPDVVTHAHTYARLDSPVGYWNVLALMMVMGLCVALAVAGDRSTPAWLRATGRGDRGADVPDLLLHLVARRLAGARPRARALLRLHDDEAGELRVAGWRSSRRSRSSSGACASLETLFAEQPGHDWAAERQRLSLPVEPHKYRAGRTILVCDTDEEARAYLKHPDCAMRWYFHYIIGLTGHGGFVGMLKNDPNMKDSDVTVDYCLENIVIAGSPETVAKKLAAFRDKVGPFETLIVSHHDWVHRDIWQRHMHLVSHKMMPILRDLTGTQHLVERARAAE